MWPYTTTRPHLDTGVALRRCLHIGIVSSFILSGCHKQLPHTSPRVQLNDDLPDIILNLCFGCRAAVNVGNEAHGALRHDTRIARQRQLLRVSSCLPSPPCVPSPSFKSTASLCAVNVGTGWHSTSFCSRLASARIVRAVTRSLNICVSSPPARGAHVLSVVAIARVCDNVLLPLTVHLCVSRTASLLLPTSRRALATCLVQCLSTSCIACGHLHIRHLCLRFEPEACRAQPGGCIYFSCITQSTCFQCNAQPPHPISVRSVTHTAYALNMQLHGIMYTSPPAALRVPTDIRVLKTYMYSTPQCPHAIHRETQDIARFTQIALHDAHVLTLNENVRARRTHTELCTCRPQITITHLFCLLPSARNLCAVTCARVVAHLKPHTASSLNAGQHAVQAGQAAGVTLRQAR